jgi:inosose dehydratase
MADHHPRFRFACAPVSWGVEDYYGPSWEQPFEQILDEMVECGYSGTELGPFGYFPTDSAVLASVLRAKNLEMLSSFVPVNLADAAAGVETTDQIRKVGSLLAALGAPCIVLADEQSKQRENIAGRVPRDGSASLTAEQWSNVARIAREAERIASDFGLDLVFHPHVATFVETPEETDRFFDAVSASGIGLCLDTGHCYYGGGDPIEIANKYKGLLRYIHIKDIDAPVLKESNLKKLNFDQAVEAGVFSQIGEGCIDFPSFFRVLQRNGYAGWCVVEQDIKFGVTKVSPKKSMGASLRYLRGVIEELDSGHVSTAGSRVASGATRNRG